MIKIQSLHKSFGGNKVLQGLSLDVEKGESLVILGGSGAGKSVLLRHLVALLRPDSGTVVVDNTDIFELSAKKLYQFRRRFGMAFQEGALFDSMSAFDNVAFPIRRAERHLKESDVRKRVEECLDLVGMPSIGKLMPSQMSGGMRRRVGFARSIALKPEILLFDEPTTGLDPIMTSVINNVIQALNHQLHTTTITITHDLSSARSIADRVAMLYRGEVVLVDEMEPFFESNHEIVRQFVEGRAEGPATESLFK